MDKKELLQLIEKGAERALYSRRVPVPAGSVAVREGKLKAGQKVSVPNAVYWSWRDAIEDKE